MKVLVTGASGFLGQHLCAVLCDEAHGTLTKDAVAALRALWREVTNHGSLPPAPRHEACKAAGRVSSSARVGARPP